MMKAKKVKAVDALVEPENVFDMAGGGGMMSHDSYDMSDIKMAAVTALHQWVESDDMSGNESYADRLFAYMVGIADENKDGEITDNENEVIEEALEYAGHYLASKGVESDDIISLLNDWDKDAAERIKDLLASVMPDGDDLVGDDINNFVFGGGDSDDKMMDAAFKKKQVVRAGKKVWIRKRVSGKVRLSAKQKVGLRKARMKSHSATARMRRKKSLGIRKKTGLK